MANYPKGPTKKIPGSRMGMKFEGSGGVKATKNGGTKGVCASEYADAVERVSRSGNRS